MQTESNLLTAPAVFAVGTNYQIMAVADENILFWVEVGDKRFYDHSNGVMRSGRRAHRAIVPMKLLDEARAYTVCWRTADDRTGAYVKTGEAQRRKYDFTPVPDHGKINLYQIADAHQKPRLPMQTAKYFGEALHLLVINGDTFDFLNDGSDFDYLYRMLSEITEGRIPVVFTKGNHDNKGKLAENLEDYTPTDCGKSYYTFRLGRIWGMVLDCGENCADDAAEYGNAVCHHVMREEETDFIRNVIADADREYAADGVEYRLILSHCAFTNVRSKPFDIEIELYREWASLIAENIQPDLMLSGHLHITELSLPGGPLDTLGQSCPVVIGANPVGWQSGVLTDFIGCGITLDGSKASVLFTDSALRVTERHDLRLEKRK